MKTYDDLLTSWEDDPVDFLQWAIACGGISKNSDTYKNLERTILDVSDIQDWINFFDGNFDNIDFSTKTFLESRKAA